MDSFTPQQTIELVARTGAKKAHMRLDKLFFNSFMSGPLLGFGCAVLVSVNASPWYQTHAPGLIRMIGALLFPVGLVMIVLTGADLWTANTMYMTASFLAKRVSVKDVAISWVVSFTGNLAGALFFVAIILGYGGVFTEAPVYREAAITVAVDKAVLPQWYQIFLRGIGANWLVCMSVFLSLQGRDLGSKIIAIWWPTATFVALALDHTIANMIFIPLGIWVGAPISVGYYIWKSLIPTALGNLIGGGFFVGTVYWYLYLTGEAGVKVAFDIGSLDTATEGNAGPLKLSGRDPAELEDVEGVQIIHGVPSQSSGGSTGHLMSNFGHEMGDNSPYAKTHKERQEKAKTEEKTDNSSSIENKV